MIDGFAFQLQPLLIFRAVVIKYFILYFLKISRQVLSVQLQSRSAHYFASDKIKKIS